MKKRLAVIIVVLLLSSCNTYHLSTQSMLEQFEDTQPEKKVTVLFLGPPYVFIPFAVEGNSLRTITVLDNKEQEHTFPVNRRMGVKITQTNGKKTTFYFNTLLLKDSTITGSKTHFFNAKIKPIRFADINKIELQR